MLKNLNRITDHLATIGSQFYGRIVIKVRDGKAVMITEERDTRLDDTEERSSIAPHRRPTKKEA
ncbi:MAG: hypothetical protein HOH43_14825 [Candidatus Latescibacteria bacterium]|nr:hypothetical protein [Candidatus Latescibacterota bacterium]